MSSLSVEKVLVGKPSYNSYSQTIAVIGPVDEVITTDLTVTTINGQSYPPPPGTGFVTLTGVETLSNKSLIDNSTWIVDVTDPTKRIAFDAAGSASTTTTLRATQTANRIYTMPDMGADTNFMFTGGSQTVTGTKSFSAGTMRVVNSGDATVYTTLTTGAAPAGTVTTLATTGMAASRTYNIIDAGTNTEFLLGAATQTVSGTKTFTQSARMARTADPTIYMQFLPGASPTGTVTTIATAVQTGSWTYTIPDAGANSTFVLADAAQTLTSKNLVDSGTFFVDNADPTIRLALDATGTTGTTATIRTQQTAARTYTVPNGSLSSDFFVLSAASQSLTNKTITDSTNTVAAKQLVDATGIVDVSASAAPVAGDVLTATSATTATWQASTTTFSDATFAVYDAVDPTVQVKFDAAGTTGTKTTITTSQTADSVFTFPNTTTTDDIVLADATQNLTNKGFASDTTYFYDPAFPTRRIRFDPSGLNQNVTYTIRAAAGTANRVFSIPYTPNDTFTFLGATQTLNNKTMLSTSNNIGANQLRTATGFVNIGPSAAPTAGQTLIAVNATTATWQTPASAPTTFSDDTFAIYDSVDNTKQIMFDAAGTAATTATIRSAQTANRIYTIPDASTDDSFVLLAQAQTLTNKTLTAPVIATIVNTGTLTLPTSTDTLIGRDTTDTLTNKTITSTTNTVAAKQLIDATGVVDVSASAAPTAGQTLVASSATVAAWATPSVTTVTGILPVANGGTGVATLTSGNVLVGAGTSAVTTTKAAPTGDFVGTTDSQNLTNKGLADNSTRVYAASNSTIFLNFDAGGTASTGTTFVVRQTANRNINFVSGGVNCNALLSEGAQTVNGVNTFTAGILTPTITETVANAGTTINSVNVRTVVSAGVNVSVVEPTATNGHLALIAPGTGAITAQIPNSAASGGNVRGTNAVDFQMTRSSATQVAGGANSGILCGNSNRVAAAGNAVIGGGNTNFINGGATNSGILCGLSNTINSNVLQGVICGGARNTAGANFAGVLAGDSNSSSGARSAVGGGDGNTAGGSNSVVAGGDSNQANGIASGVLAGATNVVSGSNAVIAGGNLGTVTNSLSSGIFTGTSNTITSCTLSAVVSGLANIINANATGRNFIGAGNNNSITTADAAILCGQSNTVTGLRAFVGGGSSNAASGNNSSVVCGASNTASGTSSNVLYGQSNIASGTMSCAGGFNMQSTADGALTLGDYNGTVLTNNNVNRAVFRFDNGYRFLTTSAFRLNNVEYTYSNLTVVSAGTNGNTVITNSTLTVPTCCAFRFVCRMQGQCLIPGAVLPGGFAGSHVMIIEGYGGTDPSAVPFVTLGTLSSTTNTNYTNANLIGTTLNVQSASATTFRFRINAAGAYGNTYRWIGSVTLYMNDFNAPDPT